MRGGGTSWGLPSAGQTSRRSRSVPLCGSEAALGLWRRVERWAWTLQDVQEEVLIFFWFVSFTLFAFFPFWLLGSIWVLFVFLRSRFMQPLALWISTGSAVGSGPRGQGL